MAEGYNRVLLLGNLGADPELKMTQGGMSILKLRLATTERYQDKNGVWQDRTEWHSVVVWGKRAEGLHKVLAKGSNIFVEGSLRTTSYEDRDGNKRFKTEVSANRVVLSGRGPGRSQPTMSDDEAPHAATGGRPRAAAAPTRDEEPQPPADDYPVDDDDLPF